MPRRWLWTEVCLALIAALCVPYLLIRPALARELLCEIPEHTHTDSCYTQLPAEDSEDPDDRGRWRGRAGGAGRSPAVRPAGIRHDRHFPAGGKTYADLVDHITAYYTDGTTETISALQADAHGNIAVTFDEEKVCDGYDIVFAEDYEMQAGGQVRFHAYTVYRDPEHTHVPDGQTKVTYTNAARSINSYPLDGETKYVYLNAQHFYNMLPSTEHLSVGKLTLYNDGTTTLAGRGGNHIGDYFLYEIDLTGSLLEPEVKMYEDLRIVDLLSDGIRYDSIYLLQDVSGLPLLDGGNAYQPEILENYHNSGRTAVIFHLNAENLQRTLATVKLAKVYFWVQIEQSARPGTVRNEVYVVGDNLAEKFIAPAGSGRWSKQGLLVKAGSDFDCLLEIVNETAAVHTGLTVYDTLPRIGDPNLFGASGRGSEFPVRRRKSAGGVFRQNAGFVCIFLQSSPAYVTLFTGKTYRRHGMDRYRIIEVKQSVFADNDAAAERLRGELDAQGTYLINLMSSPGSGKTTTLLRLLPLLQQQLRVGVMEADIDSDVDADTVSRTGAKVIQLHTGGMCHLDAGMTREGLQQLDAAGLDLVILENVGNLVCPAEFDTGAHLNLMILSVPEGHDKPLKYPLIFQTCGAMIVNKTDVLPYFDFDLDKVTAFARRRNPDLEIFPISAKTGEGVEALADWLCTRIRTHKEKKKETNA